MRKSDNANLGSLLSDKATVPNDSTTGCSFVLDGGCLLHKAKWPQKGATYSEVVQTYVSYSDRNYYRDGRIMTVVFDGYSNGPSTKDHKHLRRTSKATAPRITVDASKTVSHSQETFLSNARNKEQLI
jgi:hypothetical protein